MLLSLFIFLKHLAKSNDRVLRSPLMFKSSFIVFILCKMIQLNVIIL